MSKKRKSRALEPLTGRLMNVSQKVFCKSFYYDFFDIKDMDKEEQ